MNLDALNRFLSKENIRRHEEYLNTSRLKMSILCKSDDRLQGKTPLQINKMKIDSEIKKDYCRLYWCIRSHEAFFNSFRLDAGINPKDRPRAEKLLYDIYTLGMKAEYGFIYVYRDRSEVRISISSNKNFLDFQKNPLCIDMYEHSYLLDYGFKKDRYLKNALYYLDVGRVLDNSHQKGYNYIK
jgi:hypothetical protein